MHLTKKFFSKWSFWAFFLCLTGMVAGCGENRVTPFDNDAQLETYLKDQYTKSVTPYLMRSTLQTPVMNVDSEAGVSKDYTTTNIQEQGVDESDVVKTDGDYLYVVDDQSFHVVDIRGDMQVVATEPIKGYIDSLYLYGHILVVLYTPIDGGGSPWIDTEPMPGNIRIGMPYWIPVQSKQGVAFYDISIPAAPVNLKRVEFDGQLVSSRLVNGRLHIVQQFLPNLPPLEIWYDGTSEALEKAEAANEKTLASISLDQMIPFYTQVDDPDQTRIRTVDTKDLYHPVSNDGGGTITTVVTFNLNDETFPFTSIGLVANAHMVYSSTQALYTATHKYNSPDNEKGEPSEQAIIYQFNLTGEEVQFAAGGKVPGWILNQFSMGEYKGVLRVATTTGQVGGWSELSENHLFCLQPQQGELKTIGALDGLAPGEKIYAARLIGDRGFLVTFVNIDPLFTIDLSDPTAPKVVGELKVPGYSDYIHPLGDDYLLTIGKDTLPSDQEDFAWYQGVQLSIFDIRDFANPLLLHKEIIGARGTQSEALHNHKAFTFWVSQNLLAIPINLYEHLTPPEQPYTYGTQTFNGLYVYRVSTENGFEFVGRISTDSEDSGYSYAWWTRGIFVDETVYAVTNDLVRSAPIEDPKNVSTILYP